VFICIKITVEADPEFQTNIPACMPGLHVEDIFHMCCFPVTRATSLR